VVARPASVTAAREAKLRSSALALAAKVPRRARVGQASAEKGPHKVAAGTLAKMEVPAACARAASMVFWFSK
jgi:hypothetical protein